MFTIEAIKAAHAKVKSGADFPSYIQEIIKLGVKGYETFVYDSHTVYYGENNYQTVSPAKYEALVIADRSDKTSFQKILKEHQQGKSDYLTFCKQCAECGVEKWTVQLLEMTCTYYDKTGNELIVEKIPGA